MLSLQSSTSLYPSVKVALWVFDLEYTVLPISSIWLLNESFAASMLWAIVPGIVAFFSFAPRTRPSSVVTSVRSDILERPYVVFPAFRLFSCETSSSRVAIRFNRFLFTPPPVVKHSKLLRSVFLTSHSSFYFSVHWIVLFSKSRPPTCRDDLSMQKHSAPLASRFGILRIIVKFFGTSEEFPQLLNSASSYFL